MNESLGPTLANIMTEWKKFIVDKLLKEKVITFCTWYVDNTLHGINFLLYTCIKIMLTVLLKWTFVNHEPTSSERNMYSSFSWTNGNIQLIMLAISLSERISKWVFIASMDLTVQVFPNWIVCCFRYLCKVAYLADVGFSATFLNFELPETSFSADL